MPATASKSVSCASSSGIDQSGFDPGRRRPAAVDDCEADAVDRFAKPGARRMGTGSKDAGVGRSNDQEIDCAVVPGSAILRQVSYEPDQDIAIRHADHTADQTPDRE